MGRSALIHLIRSQSRRLSSSTFNTGCQRSIAGTWSSSPPSVNPKVRFPEVSSFNQRNWASSFGAKTREDDDEHKISIGPQEKREERDGGEAGGGVVYYGPISSTIKKVKLLSLSTCCLSVSLGPVITFMTSPGLNVIMKGAVASTVIFLSASTTAALHWFVSPYVHKLRWQPGSDTFEVEMMTWLATFTPKTLKFSDIRYPDTQRPFVSFKAEGNYYFVDAEHCPNKALLARLTPPKDAHDSAFKNL
uniref:Transmembrane protein 70, mitochondrial n=1 Tax=Noccaea caerulescens TaxID=107243 RepID=A0A1J3JKR3_NOCCA